MKNIFFLLSALLFIFSCNNSDTTTADASHINVSPESKIDLATFYQFYSNFHQDTSYQLAHINFPLSGKPSQQSEMTWQEGDKFYWTRENWICHKPVDYETSVFKRKITPLNDELVIEYIVHAKLGFGMVRRFAKLGDDWFLIYYAGMRPMKGGE